MRYFWVFVLLFAVNTIFACSCTGPNGFYNSQKITDLVVLVKVVKYLEFEDLEGASEFEINTPMAMEVEVLRVINGKEKRESIVVWGDTGYMCRRYISNYVPGEYYLLAIFTGEPGDGNIGHLNEKITDYYISSCGDYSLEVDYDNKTATGIIKRRRSTKDLDRILKKITY